MKITVLQPNLFPFKTYFDIVGAVDKVIFADDSFYNRKSWVNKTIIIRNNKKFVFKIPIISNKEDEPLSDIAILSKNWKRNFLKMIGEQYGDSVNFDKVFPMIKEVVYLPTDSASMIAAYSVFRVSELLGHDTKFSLASVDHKNVKGSFKSKIIEICKRERSNKFYTFSMYKNTFNSLFFIRNNINISYYSSFEKNSNNSIIDELMNSESLLK
jgi:hypothetical protein